MAIGGYYDDQGNLLPALQHNRAFGGVGQGFGTIIGSIYGGRPGGVAGGLIGKQMGLGFGNLIAGKGALSGRGDLEDNFDPTNMEDGPIGSIIGPYGLFGAQGPGQRMTAGLGTMGGGAGAIGGGLLGGSLLGGGGMMGGGMMRNPLGGLLGG